MLLFVNAASDLIEDAIEAVPNALLQFHGDEHEAACSRYGQPYVRALRMEEGVDLLDCEREFQSAVALMFDAPSEATAAAELRSTGAACRCDARSRWCWPVACAPGNVGDAIRRVRPYAVDVSSGVEDSPGIKSAVRIEPIHRGGSRR